MFSQQRFYFVQRFITAEESNQVNLKITIHTRCLQKVNKEKSLKDQDIPACDVMNSKIRNSDIHPDSQHATTCIYSCWLLPHIPVSALPTNSGHNTLRSPPNVPEQEPGRRARAPLGEPGAPR